MGKLSAAQRQLQDVIKSIIDKVEKNYISLAAKPFELSNNLHSVHDKGVASLASTLRSLNKQIGEVSINLLAKIEKEETKTERAKRVINNAGRKTRRTASKHANTADKAIQSVAEKVERTIN